MLRASATLPGYDRRRSDAVRLWVCLAPTHRIAGKVVGQIFYSGDASFLLTFFEARLLL